MARVDADAVLGIIDTELKTARIEDFITDAHVWVNKFLNGVCTSLTETELTVIEKYLAAHFITLKEPRLKQVKLGDVSETYQRDDKVTEYLTTAASFDPCGIIEDHLIPSSTKKRVQFRVGEGFDDDLDLPETG